MRGLGYARRVPAPIPPGKLPAPLLRSLLRSGPPLPCEVKLGPSIGEDACAIDVPAGTLVAATDPITLTDSRVGAHAVIVNANDVAVLGVRPRWFLATILLPVETREKEVCELFAAMHEALRAMDVALVGGHTELTPAVTRPVVVGQMLGLLEAGGEIVRTGGARPGDEIVQVGPAPVEGAAVLAHEARDRLGSVPLATLARAVAAAEEPGISVVEPALRCAELGATALHDPTEGGLAAGLVELADASGVRIRLCGDALWFEPGRAVCAALGADPWGTLASGTLLAALPPERAREACRALENEGAAARVIGSAEEGSGVFHVDGSELRAPARDEVARVLSC